MEKGGREEGKEKKNNFLCQSSIGASALGPLAAVEDAIVAGGFAANVPTYRTLFFLFIIAYYIKHITTLFFSFHIHIFLVID